MAKRSQPDSAQEFEAAKRLADFANVSFRLLCPVVRSGSVIGKGGEVISAIRDSTGARVRIEDTVPGCPERVIFMYSEDNPEIPLCPAQDALFRVLSRVIEEESPMGPVIPQEAITVRLLVDQSQISSVVGKGGSNLTEIRQSSRANIKVLPKAELPACALPTDELVQVQGGYDEAKQAILMITCRVREAVQKQTEKKLRDSNANESSDLPDHLVSSMFDGQDGGDLGGIEAMFHGPVNVEFRLLVPDHRIGGVIGKGGDVIRRVRQETGAKVRVADPIPGCLERIVSCTSIEDASTTYCAALEAFIRCLTHMLKDQREGPNFLVRTLVPSAQIACVLGRNGHTLKQIRQNTHTQIQILPRDQAPPTGLHDDEVLQVEGPVHNINMAIREIATLLRGHMIRLQGRPGPPPPGYVPEYTSLPGPPSAGQDYGTTYGGLPLPPPPPMGGPGSVGGGGGHTPHPLNALNLSQPAPAMPTSAPNMVMPGLQSSVKLTISQAQVGPLLGRGGCNITQVRKISGAKIKLYDHKTPTGDRELEVTGTLDQTQTAQILIQTILATGSIPILPMLGF